MAQKPNDVICRRVPLSFVDVKGASEVLPLIVDIFASEFKWDEKTKKH
jgi:glycerol-3-phosphate dehydrogenase